MDLFDRILELSRCGYFCGQILAILMLDTVGEENPGLVKAMGGLNGGVGFSQGSRSMNSIASKPSSCAFATVSSCVILPALIY